MKLIKKILAATIALSLLFCLFSDFPSVTYAAGNDNIYYIEPKLGDGASIDENELKNLYVKGILYKNGYFTFTQTKVLSFTVRLEQGWSYSSEYSSVFKGDAGSLVVNENKSANTVTFKYTASSGKSISFSSLKNVCINTTAESMPKLYLNVQGSFDRVDKESWVDCDVRLDLGTKDYNSGNFVGSGQVKGRGNYSWQKDDQKPYSINFDEKVSLLDIPATKKYAIVSTVVDESLVRNLIMYHASQDLKGIDYVVKSEPVEVYLNNQYKGIYTLCERIRITKTQINDEEATPENIKGAYLLEKTVDGKMDGDDPSIVAPFLGHPNSSGQLDRFVFADPDEVNQEMMDYVSEVVNNAHNAIMSDSEVLYEKYIDVDSWIDFIIMQEVSKNVDGDLKTSSFFLIPSNSQVLAFTSLWDFDCAFGDADWNNDASGRDQDGNKVVISGTPNADTTTGFMVIQPSSPWFVALYEKASFKQALMERYTEYRYTVLENMVNLIDYYSAYMQNSVETKDAAITEKEDIKKDINKLKNWLDKRLQWLDEQWLLESEDSMPHEVSVKISGKGTVAVSDNTASVADGGCKAYAFSADEGYELAKVVFDGRDVTADVKLGTYTTPYITKNSTLVVTFKQTAATVPDNDTYSIFIDNGPANGTISINSDSAKKGDVVSVTVVPESGYAFKHICVDGTPLSDTTFVMPAHDVTVTAEFIKIISAENNREILIKAMDITSIAKMKAIARNSCVAISDSYNNAVDVADMMFANTDASPEAIDATSLELVRLFGIMCRSEIEQEQLAVMISLAREYNVSEDIINSATVASDSDSILTAWDSLLNAMVPIPTSALLESVYSSYADEKADNYTAESYSSFKNALTAAKITLEKPSVSQSEIDKAIAELSYTGRSLIKSNGSDISQSSQGNNGENAGSNIVVVVVSITLAIAAVAIALFATVKIINRK